MQRTLPKTQLQASGPSERGRAAPETAQEGLGSLETFASAGIARFSLPLTETE